MSPVSPGNPKRAGTESLACLGFSEQPGIVWRGQGTKTSSSSRLQCLQVKFNFSLSWSGHVGLRGGSAPSQNSPSTSLMGQELPEPCKLGREQCPGNPSSANTKDRGSQSGESANTALQPCRDLRPQHSLPNTPPGKSQLSQHLWIKVFSLVILQTQPCNPAA